MREEGGGSRVGVRRDETSRSTEAAVNEGKTTPSTFLAARAQLCTVPPLTVDVSYHVAIGEMPLGHTLTGEESVTKLPLLSPVLMTSI